MRAQRRRATLRYFRPKLFPLGRESILPGPIMVWRYGGLGSLGTWGLVTVEFFGWGVIAMRA